MRGLSRGRNTARYAARHLSGRRKARMKRLTQKDEQGNWCLEGVPWEQLHEGQVITKYLRERLYGALWKLMEYEDTGLAPEEIKALNANGKTSEHRWIPVEERLPEDREDVLVCTKKGWILVAWYGPRGKRWHIALSDACMIHEDIAAWQPLPEPYRPEEGITWYPWEHRGPDVQP